MYSTPSTITLHEVLLGKPDLKNLILYVDSVTCTEVLSVVHPLAEHDMFAVVDVEGASYLTEQLPSEPVMHVLSAMLPKPPATEQ